MSNTFTKFIDSCVGNIARKIEDEFNESDHPRDKGGKFTSKGNEGRGGGASKEEKSSSSKPAKKVDAKASRHIHQVLEDEIRQIAENSADKDEFKYNLEAFLEDDVQDDRSDTDERATDNFGYDKETVHAVAEEMKGEIDSIADDFFEEEDDVGEELIQVKRAAKAARRFKSSGIDLASAMEDLDIPTEGVPEKYLESVFEGSLSEDPKLLRKAEDYIERYESGELEK